MGHTIRHKLLALFILMFSFPAIAQEAESYDCVFTDSQESKDTVHLEDAFSVAENMRMGAVIVKSSDQPSQAFSVRVYQFLMPDNQRFIQMWYGGSNFHVDGQLSVASENLQFAATLNQDDSHRPMMCHKADL